MLRPVSMRLGLSTIRSARVAMLGHRQVRPLTIQAAYAGEETATTPTKKLYVGNLSWQATNEDLKELFSRYGSVEDAFIPTDRETGRSRGFGFVVLEAEAALSAAQDLNESDFMGRTIRVNEAMAMGERPPGRGRGGFRGGGRGRGGYGRNDGGYGNRGGYNDRNDY